MIRWFLGLAVVLCTAHAFAVETIDVTIPVSPKVTLAGTLLIPDGPPPPVVVMLTGSGPQDRDESIAGKKPFRRIAEALAQRGIASIRFDDRGVGGSSGDQDTSLQDNAMDGRSAIALLCQRSDVDHRRIGILGHSGGGMAAAYIADDPGGFAFAVLLATPALTGETVLRDQIRETLRIDGISPYRFAQNDRHVQALVRASMLGEDTLRQEVDRISIELGASQGWAVSQFQFFSSQMAVSFNRFASLAAFKDFHGPVLAIYGGEDRQVDGPKNANVAADTLPDHADVHVLGEHNHLFQKADRMTAYTDGGLAPDDEALVEIVDWIDKAASMPPGMSACPNYPASIYPARSLQ